MGLRHCKYFTPSVRGSILDVDGRQILSSKSVPVLKVLSREYAQPTSTGGRKGPQGVGRRGSLEGGGGGGGR